MKTIPTFKALLLLFVLSIVSSISAQPATENPPPSRSRGAEAGDETGDRTSPGKRDWRAEEFRRFVALGESTTAGGWSTSPDRCWVSVLGDLINDFQSEPVEVFNMGIGGNLISTKSPAYERSGKPAANVRLERHVIEKNPDLVVISYGLNDSRGGTPIQLFCDEMVGLIKRIREKTDPVIVLLGPYYMYGFSQGAPTWNQGDLDLFYDYNEATKRVAQEQDCLFVDLLEAYQGADWMIHYDGVHANDLGHRIVANRIFEKLAQNCSCLAKKTKEAEKTSPRWRDESMLQEGFD